MQLDDMLTAWATHGEKIDRLLDVNEHLLRDVTTRKVRSALLPHLAWRTFEVAVGIAVSILSGTVLSQHLDNVLYVTVAGSVFLFAVFLTITTAMLIVRAMQLDHGGRVADVQHQVAKLKLAEFHAFKWALLGGVVLWLPALLVLAEALLGSESTTHRGHTHAIDSQLLAHVPLPWLLANIAFGLVALAIGQFWAKKHVDTKLRSPWGQRLLDHVSGRQLRTISRHIDELSAFSNEASAS
tara:strand:- start:1578 stop:2297 length:720 start_codon:yes stop_codon:yes gene_type:complete